MKKSIPLLLITAMSAFLLAGCAQGKAPSPFEQDNEIITYQKIDPDKTQIVVSRTGNINVKSLCKEFEAQNPDVQVVYLDITGGNSGYKPLTDWITNGYAPDIVFTSANFVDEDTTVRYFQNFSGDPVIQNYEAAALQRSVTGSDIYWLPGPSDITAMMYNKTLFDQYGWEAPETFDEFVSLCDQITADTNGEIEPWNPNAKYSNELTIALEAFTYEELFGGVDNREWYNAVISGQAGLSGHMEPYAEALQTLIDHSILREEHFSYSATTRGNEFAAGKIAMINNHIYSPDCDLDFGYMPFPTTKGTLGYLCGKYSCFVGVTDKERTGKESDAVNRFLQYFSSAEGQETYIGDSIKVSNVKGVTPRQSESLASLQPAIDAGHLFALMEFANEPNTRSKVFLHRMATDMCVEGKNGSECIAEIDKGLQSAEPAEPEEPAEAIVSADKNMTVLETSFYIADAYREAADADVGLIVNGEVFRGNVMRIFAGAVTADTVSVLKPRSFANDAKLLKVSMTGRQLLAALNNPVGNEGVSSCTYAYSGLMCDISPWNELGAKYPSVKLMNGAELEMDKLYTVAIWDGTVAPEYITEIIKAYDASWEELLTEKLRSDGGPQPAADNRIRLIWK